MDYKIKEIYKVKVDGGAEYYEVITTTTHREFNAKLSFLVGTSGLRPDFTINASTKRRTTDGFCIWTVYEGSENGDEKVELLDLPQDVRRTIDMVLKF